MVEAIEMRFRVVLPVISGQYDGSCRQCRCYSLEEDLRHVVGVNLVRLWHYGRRWLRWSDVSFRHCVRSLDMIVVVGVSKYERRTGT